MPSRCGRVHRRGHLTGGTRRRATRTRSRRQVNLNTSGARRGRGKRSRSARRLLSSSTRRFMRRQQRDHRSCQHTRTHGNSMFQLSTRSTRRLSTINKVSAARHGRQRRRSSRRSSTRQFQRPIVRQVVLVFFFRVLLRFLRTAFCFSPPSRSPSCLRPSKRCPPC